MTPNCVERGRSTVVLQPLHLRNNAQVHEWAGHFARRVLREAGDDPGRQVEYAFLLAYGRKPTADERAVCLEALGRLTKGWASAPRDRTNVPPAESSEPSRRALHNLCRALVNSAEFLYID
jgi:hypothetical protein